MGDGRRPGGGSFPSRLLGATAAMWCALAGTVQAEGYRFAALADSVGGASFGLTGFHLGPWPLDMVPGSASGRSTGMRVLGAQAGYGFSVPLDRGKGETADTWLELGGSFARAQGSSQIVSRHEGAGGLSMNSGQKPGGHIKTRTRTDARGALAAGRVRVADPSGASVTIRGRAFSPAGGGGKITQHAFSPIGNSGAFLALTTDADAPSATAYGVIYDPNGFQFAASGDVEAARVDERVSESFAYDSHNALVSTRLPSAGGWSIRLRGGPTLRHLSRRAVTATGIEMEPTVGGAMLPGIELTQSDRITGRYLGAIAGVSLSRALDPRTSLALDLRAGLAAYRGNHRRRATVAIGALGAGGHVENAVPIRGTSGLGSLSVSLSRVVARNTVASLGLSGEHVSNVPTLRPTGGKAGRKIELGSRSMTGLSFSIRLSRRF